MILIKLSQKHAYIFSFLFLLFASAVLAISYVTLSKFVFAGNTTSFEIKQRALATELRAELLERAGTEKVSFTSADGMRLQGIFFSTEHPKGNLLLCHGYKSCKEFMYRFIDMFPDYNTLIFDFRAHGESDGIVTSIGCHEYKDVIAAASFFKRKTHSPNLPFYILGISMGGAATMKASAVAPKLCDGMVIDSTYSELTTMFLRGFSLKVGLPYFPFFPIIRGMFHYFADCSITSMNNILNAQNTEIPIFFIHSSTDTFIKANESIKMYAAARNSTKAKIWIAPPCDHGYLHSYHAIQYKKKVARFFQATSHA